LFEKIDFPGIHIFALSFSFSFEITENLIYHLFSENLFSEIWIFVFSFSFVWDASWDPVKEHNKKYQGF
jgi:hypothetical protein